MSFLSMKMRARSGSGRSLTGGPRLSRRSFSLPAGRPDTIIALARLGLGNGGCECWKPQYAPPARRADAARREPRRYRVDRAAHRDVKLAMDKKAEEIILRVIREKFPGHSILSEECGRSARNPIISGSLIRWTERSTTRADPDLGHERRPSSPGQGNRRRHRRPGPRRAFSRGRGQRRVPEREAHPGQRQGGAERLHDRLRLCLNEEYLRRGLAAAGLPLAASKVRGLGSAVLHLAYVACGRHGWFFEFGINHGTSPPASSSSAKPAAKSPPARFPTAP